MPRIRKIVSKSALVLLIIPISGSSVVIEVRYAAFGTYRLYSKNRIKICTSVVIEYKRTVPGW